MGIDEENDINKKTIELDEKLYLLRCEKNVKAKKKNNNTEEYENSDTKENEYKNINKKKCRELWNKIKEDREVLETAIKVIKVNNGLSDSVLASTICDYILNDYNDKDNQDIYHKLVNLIYSNRDIACLYGNRNISFLLTTMLNDKLVLTKEQKSFLVEEAMNKPGTSRTKEDKKYINVLHYCGKFDLRYHILKSNFFSKPEKKLLAKEFYYTETEINKIIEATESIGDKKVLKLIRNSQKKI